MGQEQEIVYLSLGSNMGDRAGYLQQARQQIEQRFGLLRQASGIYETKGWGVGIEQPTYYNQVIAITTQLSPQEVLRQTQQIETDMGRERQTTWQARCIDIDILCYGQQIILQPPDLIIPHIRWHQRYFVLAPFAEIAPDFVHPIFLQTVEQLLAHQTNSTFFATKLAPNDTRHTADKSANATWTIDTKQ